MRDWNLLQESSIARQTRRPILSRGDTCPDTEFPVPVPVSTSPRFDAKQHLTPAFVARDSVGIFLIGRGGEEDMFVASKKLGAGIVFALMLRISKDRESASNRAD